MKSILFLTVISASCLNFWLFPAAAWSYRDFPLLRVASGNNSEDFTTLVPGRLLNQYVTYKYGNNAKVFFTHTPVTADLRGQAVSLSWHQNQFAKEVFSKTDYNELKEYLKSEGVTHCLYTGDTAHQALNKILQLDFQPELKIGHTTLLKWK